MYQINTGFEVLANGLLAAIIAQILKFIGFILTHQKINFKTFATTGGMPSAHSAAVISLATTVGLIEGFNSVVFAIALGYSCVVMYDAAGVRRLGRQNCSLVEQGYGRILCPSPLRSW